MKTSDTTGIFRPFEELKDLLEKKTLKPGAFLPRQACFENKGG